MSDDVRPVEFLMEHILRSIKDGKIELAQYVVRDGGDGRVTATFRIVKAGKFKPKHNDADGITIKGCLRCNGEDSECDNCGGHGWVVVDRFPSGQRDRVEEV